MICECCNGTGRKPERINPVHEFRGVKLNFRQGEVLAIFLKWPNEWLSYERIISNMYGNVDPRLLQVYVCQLNKRFPRIIKGYKWGAYKGEFDGE